MYPERRSDVQRSMEMRSHAARATLYFQSTCEDRAEDLPASSRDQWIIVMHQATDHPRRASGYELRFRSISRIGPGYAFPCDSSGSVDLDTLSETGRSHYFFARTLVGAEFYMPSVVPTAASPARPQERH